ncbi:YXWGXW repeat-containing protein [Rhodovastum atsumiense]|uniref:BcpO-related WXXGXW repeat protein n=2 Tax=Rhodovastum atsumiense TaxID=504468 RepID=A0A5M6ISC5_9PROT|nr:YXWGXW repeat-containing protein [Rhodovastum atsumiense]KAA5610375.1 hypothetical protein F1189_19640 [Rhodovastum atsumiense]
MPNAPDAITRRSLLLVPFGACIALAGCVVAPPPNPYPAPPPPRVEVVPSPPPVREQAVWQPGHWHWNGAAYEWIPGRYVARVVGSRWEPAHWAWRGGAWVWVPGHWI